jgi:hypothetical protein
VLAPPRSGLRRARHPTIGLARAFRAFAQGRHLVPAHDRDCHVWQATILPNRLPLRARPSHTALLTTFPPFQVFRVDTECNRARRPQMRSLPVLTLLAHRIMLSDADRLFPFTNSAWG